MIADGASVETVCTKPRIESTIVSDAAMAEALTPAYARWRQIYRLLGR